MTDIPQKRFTKKRLLKWTGISILALAVIYFLTCFIAELRIKAKLSSLKKTGMIVSAEEFRKTINSELPNHENAAFIITAVYNTLAAEKGYQDMNYFESITVLSRKIKKSTISPEETQAYYELMTRPSVLKAIEQLAEIKHKKGCNFKLQEKGNLFFTLDSSGYYNGPDNSELIEVMNIVELTLYSHLVNPDLPKDRIWNDLIITMRLMDQLKDDPRFVVQMVNISRLNSVATVMLHTLETSKPTDEQRTEILKLLPSCKDPSSYLRSFECELVNELKILKNQPYSLLYYYDLMGKREHLNAISKLRLRAMYPIFKWEYTKLLDELGHYHRDLKAFPETGTIEFKPPLKVKSLSIKATPQYANRIKRFTKHLYPTLVELEKALAY